MQIKIVKGNTPTVTVKDLPDKTVFKTPIGDNNLFVKAYSNGYSVPKGRVAVFCLNTCNLGSLSSNDTVSEILGTLTVEP